MCPHSMLRNKVLSAVSILLLTVVSVASQQSPLRDALQKEGYTLFLSLAQAAGITEPAASVKLTIFAPTDKAIEQFLKQMGLTPQDIKQRPGLAAAVVGYHVLPRVKGRASDVQGASRQQPLTAITADGAYFLNFFKGPDNKIFVQDVQNNTAQLLGKGTEVGNVIFYGVDKVLLSGDVFLSVADLLKAHPEFQPLRSLYTKAGLDEELKNLHGKGRSLTIFAPTAEAVQSAQPKFSALGSALQKDVLRYHLVKEALPIPALLKAGIRYATAFNGHTLAVKYNKVPSTAVTGSANSSLPHKQQEEAKQTVEIIPEDGTLGTKAVAGSTIPKVTLANMFANRFVVHGISQMLRPKLPGKAEPATAAEGGPKSGRKLRQSFRGAGGPSYSSTSLTMTQSAIRAAVEGNSNAASAAASAEFFSKSASLRCWNCLIDQAAVGH